MAGKSDWTPERDALLRKRYGEGVLLKNIAQELGVSISTIQYRCDKLELPRRYRAKQPNGSFLSAVDSQFALRGGRWVRGADGVSRWEEL